MEDKKVFKEDLLYPDLSYKIVGILYSVFNQLGYGYKEKYYQRAVKEGLLQSGLPFAEQITFPVVYQNKIIGRQVFDFLIDKRVIVELKQGNRFSRNDIVQTTGYLKAGGLKLAILARFHSKGLMFKRIVNLI